MARFITDWEVARLRSAEKDSFQMKLYEALKARTYKNTQHPGFVQPTDTQEWWHLCWERASDAAFTWHMEKDEKLGEWIRNVAFWMRDLEDTEWIGPWFRSHARPLKGHLETAHVCLAMLEILDLCEGLFTEEEKKSLEEALKVKGMGPALIYCERVVDGSGGLSNWYNVLLMGYGACALYFEDQEAIEKMMDFIRYSYNLYNKDSYGETVQYSNYASLTLSHLNELILRMRPDLAAQVDLGCYGRLMPWYAASFLYMKPWDDETIYPRSFNFGDSAAVFRPTGDMLAQIAVRGKDIMPKEAALAAWLFETTYAHPEQGPDEMATFGFYNQFRYHAVLMQPDMCKAKTPGEVDMEKAVSFETGNVIIRDSWENTRGALAVQAGYEPLNVAAHRHRDLGSFQFAVGKERMIIDGGHCCYRLNAQRFTTSTAQHSVIDFCKESNQDNPWAANVPVTNYYAVLGQKTASGNFLVRQEPLVKNQINQYFGDAHVLTMDLTDVYSDHASLVRRAIVSVLPHAVFIIDQAETTESLRMRNHFPINNRDNALDVHRVNDHRYVFRRGGEGLKVIHCENFVDGESAPSMIQFEWGYCHKYYHPQANKDCQGKEGSAEIYNWIDPKPGKKHLRLVALAASDTEDVRCWHIVKEENGDWHIEDPKKNPVLTVRLKDDSAYLIQNGEAIRIL